ncbi:MAG: hypothetical protein GX802_05035 [Clostridiales bacterium]|nr:hypothetical protein [Clostridiales bacterium]
MEEKTVTRLFTPYYINQNRLFDIFSILNNGYCEYEEITTHEENAKKSSAKAEASITGGGFKLINIFGSIAGTNETGSNTSSGITSKRVQTVSSILKTVLDDMERKHHIRNLDKCEEGGFFYEPVTLKLNSLKRFLDLIKEIVDLQESMSKQSLSNIGKLPCTKKQIEDLTKAFRFILGGLEVLYETDEYAIIANIDEKNLYLSNLDDIVNTKLHCFGHIKKIQPKGTRLLKNTYFSKVIDESSKKSFYEMIGNITGNNTIELDITVKPEIVGKKVYEIEIISLCK